MCNTGAILTLWHGLVRPLVKTSEGASARATAQKDRSYVTNFCVVMVNKVNIESNELTSKLYKP